MAGIEMSLAAELERVQSAQALERLSVGEPVQGVWITGCLDLDPLVVSRWLCGEDMRGIYQPIVLRACVLDDLTLDGRTFYEQVSLSGCHLLAAHFARTYFYSALQIEGCVIEGEFQGQALQNDGRMLISDTVFTKWAEFGDLILGGRASLTGVSFLGGTNLLHVMAANGSQHQLGQAITFSECRFLTTDVPAELDAAGLGIQVLAKGPSGAVG